MDDLPPRYDGTLHPEVWIQDLRFFCALRGVYDQSTVINIAILRIDPDIPIPKDISSFSSLINVLKEHFTHTVFRADSLEKLDKLKCERNRDMSEFIAKFISLCRGANITDKEEKKKYLLRNLPDDMVRNAFRNRIENLNSFDKMIETFKDVMLEHRRQIRYGSKIALKHVATGRFLSSKDVKYDSGSKQYIVFCNNWQPDKKTDFWIVIPPHEQYCKSGSPVAFNSAIGLKHQQTSRNLHSHTSKSPKTNQQEVTCWGPDTNDDWLLQRHSINNDYDNSGYWKIGDIISLRHVNTKKSLSSHDFLLDDGNQEVTCHADGHEENHKWIVEVFE
ncbi:hypothetical protein RclHR1_05410007 [Rhizophagus clarus]|uniref:MIR domain-containing protein n=1 Tax=Rhizophagus clarus TaxID=94130 RepID=A0A2Z6RNT4_9GLOM|nr:hypothetical protein RclHR1_05410007 [Rhizophagus clarus]GES91421.1 hypothetical protein GLOIN_2v1788372 [Rhizophagus clarus]